MVILEVQGVPRYAPRSALRAKRPDALLQSIPMEAEGMLLSEFDAAEAHRRTAPTGRSWRMDETYVKVKGEWTYLYRTIDKEGKTYDFMLSERRDEAAVTAFFIKATGNNGWPDKVVIDKSGSNTAGLFNMNCLLVMWGWLITVRRTKYLNNIIEQDHRFVKKLIRPTLTFKSLNSASATLAGIEVAHMIRKSQFDQSEQSGFARFAALAG